MKKVDLFLVEDNPHDAHILRRILKKEGLTESVHWVKDGEAAVINLVEQEAWMPKLILLDIKLPKVSGLEVLSQIRNNEKIKEVPVIMLTSSYQQVDVNKAYQLGVNGYLIKPDNYIELKETLIIIAKFWLTYNLTVHQGTQ